MRLSSKYEGNVCAFVTFLIPLWEEVDEVRAKKKRF